MAGTGDAIAEVLVNLMQIFDSSLDVSSGSRFDVRVLQPLRTRYNVPEAADGAQLILSRLRTEMPQLATGDLDALRGILIDPLSPIVDVLRSEIGMLRNARRTTDPSVLRREDIDQLAANFFVSRAPGTTTTGTVRVYFRTAQNVQISAVSRYSTSSGLVFLPLSSQSVPVDRLRGQRSGTEYWVDVAVIAEKVGPEYGVAADTVRIVTGVPGAIRCSNLADFAPGAAEQTNAEVIRSIRSGLTEASLTTRRGIHRAVYENFPGVRAVEVIGAGDPEMERDLLVAEGDGHLLVSGMAFVVGSTCLLFSVYDDAEGDTRVRVQPGDRIRFQYPRWIYTSLSANQRREDFTVQSVIFDGQDAIEEALPPILMVQMDRAPSVIAPPAPAMPGVHPGVAVSIFSRTNRVYIGSLPDQIQFESVDAASNRVDSGEVHVGGKVDVYARVAAVDQGDASVSAIRSPDPVLEGEDLVLSDGARTTQNCAHRTITVTITDADGAFVLGEELLFRDNNVRATLARISSGVMTLIDATGTPPSEGEVVGVASGSEATVTAMTARTWDEDGVRVGMALIPLGQDTLPPRTILALDGPFAWTDVASTTGASDVRFRVIDASSVDLFDPVSILIPFGAVRADDLHTTVGSAQVRLDRDAQSYGVVPGDILELLDGPDAGKYPISGWSTRMGGNGPILSTTMRASRRNRPYRILRQGTGANRPLIRILPGGVTVTDEGGSTGTVVPYALPVAAYAETGLPGATAIGTGTVGFVLPDPGDAWAPDADIVPTIEGAHAPYSSGYVDADGVVAVCTLTDDGVFYVDADLPEGVAAFITHLQAYFRGIGEVFGFGEDYDAFVQSFLPLNLSPPPEGGVYLLQFEIVLPDALFDGVNNAFLALPEIDWSAIFSRAESFADALSSFRDGAANATASALSQAQPGDALTITDGCNAGSYRIRRVLDYALATPGSIVDGVASLDRCYRCTVVLIDGEFPAAPMGGLAAFLADGLDALSTLPPPLAYPGTALDENGNISSPWQWVQISFTWFFRFLRSLGFEYPDTYTLRPGDTLAMLWRALFTPYAVARPGGTGRARIFWQEPTTARLYCSAPARTLRYQLPEALPAVWSSGTFSVPIPLDGMAFSVEADGATLSCSFDGDSGDVETIAALAAHMQTLLDPASVYIEVTGTNAAHGTLTITSFPRRNPSTIAVACTLDATTAARAFGVYDDEGAPALYAPDALPADPASVLWRVEMDVGTARGFGMRATISGSEVTSDIDIGPSIDEDRFYGYHEIATYMQTSIEEWLTSEGALSVSVSVTFDVFNRYRIVASGSNLTAWGIVSPSGAMLLDMCAILFGSSAAANIADGGMDASGDPLTVLMGRPTLFNTALLLGVRITGTAMDETTWEVTIAPTSYAEAFDTFFPLLETAHAGNCAPLAAFLNDRPDAYASEEIRRVWYVGTGDDLRVRSVEVGDAVTITIADDGGAGAFGWTADATRSGLVSDGTCVATGEQELGAMQAVTVQARAASRIRHVDADGRSIDFEVVDSTLPDAPDSGTVLLPPATRDGAAPISDYPRDLRIEDAPDGGTTLRVFFGGEGYAPIQMGVRAGDYLDIYAQRVLLEPEAAASDLPPLSDRPIGVLTTAGSNRVRLPRYADARYTFLAPESREDDAVLVGDILWLEEGADRGAYTVTRVVDDTTLLLDRNCTQTTATTYRSGNHADTVFGTRTVTISEMVLTLTDVGRWLCVWGARTAGVSGAYRITQMTPPSGVGSRRWTVTLDMEDTFPASETDLEWALIRPPDVAPGVSAISGNTELVAVIPCRIYNGTPTTWDIAYVYPDLSRTSSWLAIVLSDAETLPLLGVSAPHRIRRTGERLVTAPEMSAARDRGLFYVDVDVRTVSADLPIAVPAETRLEPVVGTFDVDGYWLSTADPKFAFTDREQTRMYLSRGVLRDSLLGDPGDRVTLEGSGLTIQYAHSALLQRVQAMFGSAYERQLCADHLVRSYLPTYVYLDIQASSSSVSSSGSSGDAVEAIRSHINNLSADATITLATIEGLLHRYGLNDYTHPIWLWGLTHDLDRRIVGWRSVDRLDDSTVPFHGTARTTAFIAGVDASGVTDEADTPLGERIRIA